MPVIAAVTAAILLILQQVLMIGVGLQRRRLKLGVGIGTDREMERVVRRHGNLAENAAIYVVTLALLELIVGSTIFVAVLAGLFLVARILHIIAFSSLGGSHGEGNRKLLLVRMIGVLLTAIIGIVTAGYLLIAALGA
jgi:uncharacterized protein